MQKRAGGHDDLAQIDGMTTNMLVALGENDIKTLDDFAGVQQTSYLDG